MGAVIHDRRESGFDAFDAGIVTAVV